MGQSRKPQVVVGVDGTLASLEALRCAAAEARRRSADLSVVHALPVSYAEPAMMSWTGATLEQDAYHSLRLWVDEALGGPPAGLRVCLTVVEDGAPGRALLRQTPGDDSLIVVGTSRRRRLGLRRHLAVGPYCARRAVCPVLVVPPTRMARELCGRRGPRWRSIERQLADDLRVSSPPDK